MTFRSLACLALAALAGGCMLLPRRVKLGYTSSKNAERRARQTQLAFSNFIDKRKDKRNFGRAPIVGELSSVAITPKSDPALWASQAATAELAAAGYVPSLSADWKVGGAINDISCGSGKRTICTLKLEIWITQQKDGWQVLKSVYAGEGVRPPMFAGEDPYELSLEEALREALTAFRRDVERMVP